MRPSIDALPNGDPDSDPQECVNDNALALENCQSACDFLVTADEEQESSEGPDDDIYTSEATDAGTEDIDTGVPVSVALASLRLAQRFFEEHQRQYDVQFVYQLNRMISAIEAVQAGIAVRSAREKAGIRRYFS